MSDKDCYAISELWIQLNPHAQIHGCEIREGSVFIYLLYRREGKNYPLELCLGNPARSVLRGLRQAVNEQGRTQRLTRAYGSKVVGETSGSRRKNEI